MKRARPKEPQTRDEWQEAVDSAEFFLLLDSARQYGLIGLGNTTVNADRCSELLQRGRAIGVTPAAHSILVKRYLAPTQAR